MPPSPNRNTQFNSRRERGITHELRNSEIIYIYFDPSYSALEKKQMTLTFDLFRVLGLRPRLVESFTFEVRDVYVRNSDEFFSQSDLGLYASNTSYIQVPTNRIESRHQLQMIFMHEMGHWLGMKHVCVESERLLRIDCSPVGYGTAIMNPINVPALAAVFSRLDQLEFQRINHL